MSYIFNIEPMKVLHHEAELALYVTDLLIGFLTKSEVL